MAQYAIARVAKLKTTNAIKAVSNHNHRHGNTPNANKSEDNEILKGSENALADWQERIDHGNISIRNKTTVRALEVLLTTSKKFGDALRGNAKAMATWKADEMRFLKEEYGEKNVVNVVAHLDETTPHIHAVIVPEFENKLNAKHFTNGKKALADFQTRHFENFSPMLKKHLSRGKKQSQAKHKTMQEMYNEKNGPVEFEKLNERVVFLENENETLSENNETLKIRNSKLLETNVKISNEINLLKNPKLAERLETEAAEKKLAEENKNIVQPKKSRIEQARLTIPRPQQTQQSRGFTPKPPSLTM